MQKILQHIKYLPSIHGLALSIIFALTIPLGTLAQSAQEIQSEIDGHSAQIEQLNKEIAAYEKQLAELGSKKQTLQNTLSQLDIQRKKLNASISATKSKIRTLELEIQNLAKNIRGKEESIEIHEDGLAENLRRLNETESQTLAVSLFSGNDLSVMWTDIDRSFELLEAVRESIDTLSNQKASLTETKTATEAKQSQLLKEQRNLVAEQGSLDATRKAQAELLAQTKSQESNYQAILTDKQAAKASFEAALSDLKVKLQYTVDPSKIPPAGKGILRWPIDNVKVTQYFGNTDFARAGGYSGKGHNGIDLRATIGTPIRSALTGTVVGTGNTDAVRGCYSYGKWVMIKHGNGLSTLYAHLSQINVSEGESIATGQVLGYSGATGYATGPHLHFGVYATQAVQILRLGEATNKTTACANATMPVAPLSGYLNPIDYL
ncbi:peptidoglycan DD-metalloendopeptidase family protein [Candidatus Kaiserbacteria bacterium]|nr:peptidoglycan DD-metalloendopeptidase family protein [Candidatus Kaiserbacteria bacterium]